jgi:hypothetical protein
VKNTSWRVWRVHVWDASVETSAHNGVEDSSSTETVTRRTGTMIPPVLRRGAGFVSSWRGFQPALSSIAANFRLFSSTPSVAKYKLKSHSGAKKRWKSIASGAFKRVRNLLIPTLKYIHLAAGSSRSCTFECHEECRTQEQARSHCVLAWLADTPVKEIAPMGKLGT